jgi:CBS domain-containing protein
MQENVLFYLTPKKDVEYLYGDFTIRQALEKMEYHRYATIPVLDRSTGEYLASISEGDILYYLKDRRLSFNELSDHLISDVTPARKILPITIDTEIDSLYHLIISQNYVPIVDDGNRFIGIVTRKSVIEALLNGK